MSTGLDNRPSANTYEVEELVKLAWRGQIRVPHFQRGFRWGRTDVIRLFDSIIRGYPVGSLLLWVRKAQSQRLTLGPLTVDSAEMEEALWVVDGQQRVISLASALHPDGARDSRFALAYDLRNEKFVPLNETVFEPHIIPLPTLFELPELLKWFSTYPEANGFQNKAYDVTTLLRKHPIPAYLVKHDDSDVLRDIFDRMNNYGKRLSRAEVFTALHVGEETEHTPARTFELISGDIDHQTSFGWIDDDTVHSAILARRGVDVHREIRIEFSDKERRGTVDFPDEDKETAFRLGEDALRKAVDFVQNDAGIPHFTLLPYRYLLVVLTRIFGHFPDPDRVNRKLIRRWLWRTAILGPQIFPGGTTGAVRQLCGKVRPGNLTESVQELLNTVSGHKASLPDLLRFRTNTAATKITLCSWWALEPRDPSTGQRFDFADLAKSIEEQSTAANAVKLFFHPRNIPASQRGWAANRLLLPKMEFDEEEYVANVMATPPISSRISEDVEWDEIPPSHLISPDKVLLLRKGQASDFLKERQKACTSQLQNFLEITCEWGFEDTPPLDDLLDELLDHEGDDDAP